MCDLGLPPRSRRELLFWVITQRVVRNFLLPFRDNLSVQVYRGQESWALKMGRMVCTETQVRNYY